MKTNLFSKALGLLFLFLMIAFSQNYAQNVLPGSDRLNTSSGGGTFLNLPLPPNFFGPGSDPFFGVINFQGAPLSTLPGGALGTSDVVVQRLAPAILGPCPSADAVPIEIVALHLVSVQPITVTYGGNNPEQWNVQICLSGTTQQQPGNMQIIKSNTQGGTFTSVLPVIPKFTFTRIGPPGLIDLDFPNVPVFSFTNLNGNWVYGCPSCTPTPPGILVDHNCDGFASIPILPSSNFFPGIGSNGDCNNAGLLSPSPLVFAAPSQGAQHTVETPFPQQSNAAVPTLPEWALIIFGLLLVLVGALFIFKR